MKKIIVVILTLIPTFSWAASNENWSIGLLGNIVTSNQSDMNTLITRANVRVGGVTTQPFGNAYEFGGYIQRRLTGSGIALQLRPSYFTTSTSGTGAGGAFNYSLTGYAVAPLLKYYILENTSVKLYLIGGINWGLLTGKIQEASGSVTFSGSNVGYQGGLGTLFCFGSKGAHCLTLEGQVRYLYIERNVASEASGSFSSSNPPSLSQGTVNREVELDQKDLATSMTGVQGVVGYQFNF